MRTAGSETSRSGQPTTGARGERLARRLAAVLSGQIPWPTKLRLEPMLDRFDDLCDAEISRWLDVPPRRAAALRRELARGIRDLVPAELARVADLPADLLIPGDAAYPIRLNDLAQPPLLLYARSEIQLEALWRPPAAALVGPRNADPYGLECARGFAGDLAAAGVLIVSGFARGVDLACHRAAIEVGHTAAVLGCGLDVPYPTHHRCAADIARRGAVITEFPCGSEPRRWHFPLRNRLIAALGDLTLVVQASRRSGSLLTAHAALELGRDVWAVPGRLTDARSSGANLLLRDGAGVALRPRDLLETLGVDPVAEAVAEVEAESAGRAGEHADRDAASPHRVGASEADRTDDTTPRAHPPAAAHESLARRVLALLAGQSRSPEQLARGTGRPVAEVLATLGSLELEGLVRRAGGDRFAVVR